MKNTAHDSQIVRAKENLTLSHGGPATDKHQVPTHQLKVYVRAVIESEASTSCTRSNLQCPVKIFKLSYQDSSISKMHFYHKT